MITLAVVIFFVLYFIVALLLVLLFIDDYPSIALALTVAPFLFIVLVPIIHSAVIAFAISLIPIFTAIAYAVYKSISSFSFGGP